MKNLSNIEKSGFHRGQYVGYCNGAWKIWRHYKGGLWHANQQNGSGYKSAATLTELNYYFACENGKGGGQ